MGRVLLIVGLCWSALAAFAPAAPAGADAAALATHQTSVLLHRVVTLLTGLSLAGCGLLLGSRPRSGRSLLGGGAFKQSDHRWLWALLALATGLRLWNLGNALWYDEMLTLMDFVRLPFPALLTSYTTPNNHVLYSLSAKASIGLLGESAFALRLPALLFGVASVFAVLRLGTQLGQRAQAWLVALLLSVSYHHVWFSQNARGYTGLLLWTVLSTALFIEGLRHRRRALWLAYAATLALGAYTHLTAVFAFAGHGLVYLGLLALGRLRPKSDGQDPYPGSRELWPLLGFSMGALLTLQCYGILLPQMFAAFGAATGEQSEMVKVHEWQNPLWTALEILRGLQIGPLALVVVLCGGAVFAVGFFDYLRRRPAEALLLVLHIPITLAVTLLAKVHIWPRYFFVDAGFVLLVAVNGVAVVTRFAGQRLGLSARLPGGERALLGAAAAVLLLASAAMLPRNYRMPKQDFRGGLHYVNAHRGDSDAVVTAGLSQLAYARFYETDFRVVNSAQELEAIRSRHDTTWLVFSFATYMRQEHLDIVEAADRHFTLEKTLPGSLGDGYVFVYRASRP